MRLLGSIPLPNFYPASILVVDDRLWVGGYTSKGNYMVKIISKDGVEHGNIACSTQPYCVRFGDVVMVSDRDDTKDEEPVIARIFDTDGLEYVIRTIILPYTNDDENKEDEPVAITGERDWLCYMDMVAKQLILAHYDRHTNTLQVNEEAGCDIELGAMSQQPCFRNGCFYYVNGDDGIITAINLRSGVIKKIDHTTSAWQFYAVTVAANDVVIAYDKNHEQFIMLDRYDNMVRFEGHDQVHDPEGMVFDAQHNLYVTTHVDDGFKGIRVYACV